MYEVLDHSGFYTIRRRMSLDGRMNLVFEEMGPTRTRVTANTRYIITRSIQVEGFRRDDSSISFNSGSVGYFPVIGPEPDATKCVATGKLERDVLSLINGGELHPHSRSPENWSDLE